MKRTKRTKTTKRGAAGGRSHTKDLRLLSSSFLLVVVVDVALAEDQLWREGECFCGFARTFSLVLRAIWVVFGSILGRFWVVLGVVFAQTSRGLVRSSSEQRGARNEGLRRRAMSRCMRGRGLRAVAIADLRVGFCLFSSEAHAGLGQGLGDRGDGEDTVVAALVACLVPLAT